MSVKPGTMAGKTSTQMQPKRAFQVRAPNGDWHDVSAVSDDHARRKVAARLGVEVQHIGDSRIKPGAAAPSGVAVTREFPTQ
jgi:hypothetical protein